MKKSQVGKAGYHAENWLTKQKRKILPTALVNVMVRKLGCFARCQNWLNKQVFKKNTKKWLSRGSVLNTMKWKPWVFKTVSIPSDVRCLHLKQNALQKGNLFGRVETITPYIEGFHSSIDAKLIKSDITDVLVFVWRQTCTHLDRRSLVVVSVTINLNIKSKLTGP